MVAIAGIWLRIAGLSTIPSLEHDESLICLGARDIVQNHAVHLTGDKVYEGPLLEYLISLSMAVFGPGVAAARYVMVLAAILSVGAICLAGSVTLGTRTGIIAALLILFSPWHLAASRVIYACNLSTLWIPLWIYFLMRYSMKRSLPVMVAGALMLGLAANGRITAYLLLLPALGVIMRSSRKDRGTRMAAYVGISLLPSLPVIFYNGMNGCPAWKVLAGSGQGHLFGTLREIPLRIVGYAQSLQAAVSGQKYWLDTSVEAYPWLILLTIAAYGGILLILIRDPSSTHWIPVSWFLLMILIPALTKSTGSGVSRVYLPHYMDLTMPFMILFAARGIEGVIQWRRLPGIILCSVVVLLQGYLVFGIIVPDIASNGRSGRWFNNFREEAAVIRNTFSPESARVLASWQFQAGYPQMRFFLPEFHVRPVLGRTHGFPGADGNWEPVTLVQVSENPRLYSEPWAWISPDSRDPGASGIWHVQSPGLRIDGVFYSRDTEEMIFIRSVDHERPSGVWPQIVLASCGRIDVLDVLLREDQQQVIPSIVSVMDKVTPRHRSDLERISRWTVAHNLTCKDPAGAAWILEIESEPRAEGIRRMRFRRGMDRLEGEFKGRAIFY